MKVYFYDQSGCEASRFSLDINIIPRIGENVMFPKSALPQYYFEHEYKDLPDIMFPLFATVESIIHDYEEHKIDIHCEVML